MDPSLNDPEMPEVRRITSEATLPLRMQVLRAGRPQHESCFPGDDAPDTVHAGAVLDGRVVAIGSMFPEGRPADAPGNSERGADHDAGTAWRLRGMATDPAFRRRGAGSAALAECERAARERGATLLWCNARTPAVPFYEAHGWTALGTEFEIPTAGPHFVMEKPVH